MIKKRYLNEFTDREKELFTRIEKDKERWSAMSIYAYFKKLFKKAGTEELEISYRDFLKRYKHHHKKISLDTLGRRIRLLVQIELLVLIKNGQNHIYRLTEATSDDFYDRFSDSFSDKGNNTQSPEITKFVEDCEIPNTKYLNNNIYNKYISASKADAICDEVIKELDIKRKIVKNAIKLRIKQFANKINPTGAYQYIMKVAIDTYNFFKASAERANKIISVNKKTNTKKTLKFQNYPQREYDYEALEDELFGWD